MPGLAFTAEDLSCRLHVEWCIQCTCSKPQAITVVAQPLQRATTSFTEAPGDAWAGAIRLNHIFTRQKLKVCLLYPDERAKWAASSFLAHVAMAHVKAQNQPCGFARDCSAETEACQFIHELVR